MLFFDLIVAAMSLHKHAKSVSRRQTVGTYTDDFPHLLH